MKPEDVQKEIESAMKQLVNDGYLTGTLAFGMAKYDRLEKVAKKCGVPLPFLVDLFTIEWQAIVAVILRRLGINLARWAYWLSRLRKLLYILHPIQIYKMDGRKLYFNWMDLKSRYIFEDYLAQRDTWEPITTALVKEKVKKGDVCLDIGASIGYFTLLFSELTGKEGRVYAFEPMSRGYKYLLKNIRINGYKDRAQAFQVGAWDKYETVGMPRNDSESIPVQCIPISDFLEKRGVTKVDFIKLDIDGSEPWALKGLIPTFEANPQLQMVCEFYPKYIENAGGNPQDVLDILNRYFTVTEIQGDYGNGCWNYYCVRK